MALFPERPRWNAWVWTRIISLKDDTYSIWPITIELLSFEADGVYRKTDKSSAVEANHIKFDFTKHPDALRWKAKLPQAKDALKKDFAKWRLTEPQPLGEYYWDEGKTVEQNLTLAYGRTFTEQDDLPKTITLEADWENKYSVAYDANGGAFDGNSGAVGDRRGSVCSRKRAGL